jgi:hypothetical protein
VRSQLSAEERGKGFRPLASTLLPPVQPNVIGRIDVRKLTLQFNLMNGAACVTRTRDPRITNAVLYQLS